MRYTFTVYQEDSDITEEFNLEMNFQAVTTKQVVDNFELFLRGAGFHPDSIKEELGREL